jgi:hypothetical protein
MADAEGKPPRTTEPKTRPADRDEPVLPDVSRDELDVGWGDEPSERDDDWYRRERPPHHG